MTDSKSNKSKPVIATDIDGVVIQWQSALSYFALKYNLPVERIIKMMINEEFVSASEIFDCSEEEGVKLIELYNSSDFIRYLAAYRDALEVINRLSKDYDFVGITALGTNITTKLNRQFNLNALFPGAFKAVLLCDYADSKTDLYIIAKQQYNVIAYVDDLSKHVDAADLVFDNIPLFYMPRGPRKETPTVKHVQVNNWFDIEKWLVK
ncbi:hypothetical protein KNT64_gp211 [Pseudomonas phage PspYZU05]|uniref:Uncharacterized protein n=1 Tax=Pseudomonas phage PspYZU05 TaxID=1983556 RepID=A0A2U7N8F4_9CAUD|nr:hypothetical protein KNT64_gp211 [Pseudomonas phage PspYZU05]ASD52163.1 hypothetical protein PspYZU05_211 [Pseudomonas phage PspYZU05]